MLMMRVPRRRWFLEPVAALEAVAAGLAAEQQVGLAGFDFGPGRDVLGQQGRAYHQRNRDDPEHAQQLHAADAGHPQDDQLVALGQARQRQNGADQQADGKQVVETGRDRQRCMYSRAIMENLSPTLSRSSTSAKNVKRPSRAMRTTAQER